MDLQQVGTALSNTTRLKLLQLVAEQPDPAIELFRRYLDTYDDDKHRESIYRALETLVEADVLGKEYRNEQGLVYHLEHDRLLVDLRDAAVEPVSREHDRE